MPGVQRIRHHHPDTVTQVSESKRGAPALLRSWRWASARPALLPVVLSVTMAAVFALTVPHFADLRNLLNIFEQLGVLGFLAVE